MQHAWGHKLRQRFLISYSVHGTQKTQGLQLKFPVLKMPFYYRLYYSQIYINALIKSKLIIHEEAQKKYIFNQYLNRRIPNIFYFFEITKEYARFNPGII